MEEIDPHEYTSGKIWETENGKASTEPIHISTTQSSSPTLSNPIVHLSSAATSSTSTSPLNDSLLRNTLPSTTYPTVTQDPIMPSIIEPFNQTIESPTKMDRNFVERDTLTSFDLQLHQSPYQSVVTKPSKHGEGLKDAYVSYLIQTKEMEQGVQHQVRRRFTDFVWLHHQLTTEYPDCIVCPLPDKHRMEYITGDRFSGEFLEKRRSSLNRFLNRILRHPILQNSPDLNLFLTSTNWNLDQMRLSKKERVFENLSDAILNAFSKLKHPDPKFLEMKEQVARLEEHLQNFEKCYMKMIKRHLELEHEYAELGAGITSLGVLEAHITGAMTEVGAQLYAFAKNFHERAHHEDVHLAAQLRDYLNYCNTVKVGLKVRDHKQLDNEILGETYEQYLLEKNRLESNAPPAYTFSGYLKGKYEEITGVDQERARIDRIHKLDLKLSQLQVEMEFAKKNYTEFSQRIAKEVDFFQATRSIDFKEIFLDYTDHQIQFFQKVSFCKGYEAMGICTTHP